MEVITLSNSYKLHNWSHKRSLHLWIQTFSLQGTNLLQMIGVEKKMTEGGHNCPLSRLLAAAIPGLTTEMNRLVALPPQQSLHAKEEPEHGSIAATHLPHKSLMAHGTQS